ncbi:hypothetical protein B0T20DRAFT_399349 [Sordaria brevicollis]|uniref:Uncharacterized protein n=1 Tax=Sordaria brevicollis TaxID=83679 RepID=A0AAE0PN90_SORBR|nr:hypothetical protein B0T20DRAFT_399349 [Sordaria brevicollis]
MLWGIAHYSATLSEEAHQQFSSGEAMPIPSHALKVESEAATNSCPIQQIELEGATILDAWFANEQTKEMELRATNVPPDADPSTMPYKALPVYHGTDWVADNYVPVHSNANPFDYNLKATLRRGNQAAPTHSNLLSVIWTEFSPLRCFLWATFKAEVLQNIPTGTYRTKLEKTWTCRSSMTGGVGTSHTHSGLTLYEFRPTLPSAHNQTHYIMPKGKEAEWDRICKDIDSLRVPLPLDLRNAEGAKILWDQFSAIHHGVLPTWPTAIHCREFGQQEHILQSFTTQQWRTVWFECESTLKERREAIYAISFKLVAPPKASPGYCCW